MNEWMNIHRLYLTRAWLSWIFDSDWSITNIQRCLFLDRPPLLCWADHCSLYIVPYLHGFVYHWIPIDQLWHSKVCYFLNSKPLLWTKDHCYGHNSDHRHWKTMSSYINSQKEIIINILREVPFTLSHFTVNGNVQLSVNIIVHR